ncbi:transposase [bacterium BD-1]|nr:transposase [Ottowia caeni]
MLELIPQEGAVRHFSGCEQPVAAIHDCTLRRVRDFRLFEHAVELVVPRLRLACPRCGPRLRRLDWLDPHARVTRRLAQNVARLRKGTSVRHAARWFGLDGKTAKAIDFRLLGRTLGPPDLDGVRLLAMDEFAIQTGHRNATVVVDPERKRVLWVGRGRFRAEIRPFFELLGPERCAQGRAVAMDMNTVYDLEVRAHCPNAEVVYNLFHVVAKYGREVIDAGPRGRGEPAADGQSGPAAGQNIGLAAAAQPVDRARRLGGAAGGSAGGQPGLADGLPAQGRPAGPMALPLRGLGAKGLEELEATSEPYRAGILGHCRWSLGTNLVEDINNKIKFIKRVA